MAEEQIDPQSESQEAAGESVDSLLDQVIATTQQQSQRTKDEAEGLLAAMIKAARRPGYAWDRNTLHTINKTVNAIDEVLSEQLAKILHHEEFRRLEGSWRGLKFLIDRSELGTDTNIYVNVLNVKHSELKKDFETASDFDTSALFQKIYEGEFGQAGGKPYGALIYDHEFENHPEEIKLLQSMAGVSAAAFAPLLTSAGPRLFGFDSFRDMRKINDLKNTFEGPKYAAWRAFRESDDSRYVSLSMPKVLARQPYGRNTKAIEDFGFEEVPLNEQGENKVIDDDQYCWMNAAYVMGTRLTDAFAKYGWCTAIRGHDSGGRVDDLPVHTAMTDDGDVVMNCPTEVQITDRREKELSDAGFLPLVHWKDTNYAVFMGGQSVQKAARYDDPDATANAKICARLPYVLASSRIAHYIKILGRQWIGSFKEAEDVQRELERWVAQYVSADSNPSEEARAKYPLREARIAVKEDPSSPGAYNAVMWLRPWMQMEELNASVRMVARLPEPK